MDPANEKDDRRRHVDDANNKDQNRKAKGSQSSNSVNRIRNYFLFFKIDGHHFVKTIWLPKNKQDSILK